MTDAPRTFPPHPLVGVGGIVFRAAPDGGDRNADVLLIRRANPPRQGEWSLPGGLQHLGETVVDAVCREVLEETGVLARPLGVVDVVDLIDRDATGRVIHQYTLVEVALAWQRGEPVAGSDAAEARWFPLAAIDTLGMWTETVRVIRMAHDRLYGATRNRALPGP
ncbi:MAG: NUDIX domain-containing protein [Rhodospirillales bacterium]|nr:MAG: NUDIX domain-containing protein [Rhodospirillales bacterium]